MLCRLMEEKGEKFIGGVLSKKYAKKGIDKSLLFAENTHQDPTRWGWMYTVDMIN